MGRFDLNLESVSTERVIIADGTKIEGIISEAKVSSGTSDKEGNPKWLRLDITVTITTPEILELLGNDSPKLGSNILVGIDQETLGLSSNNADLGKFLEAFDLRSKEKEDQYSEGLEEIDDPFDYLVLVFKNMMNDLQGTSIKADVIINKYQKNGKDQENNRLIDIAPV